MVKALKPGQEINGHFFHSGNAKESDWHKNVKQQRTNMELVKLPWDFAPSLIVEKFRNL